MDKTKKIIGLISRIVGIKESAISLESDFFSDLNVSKIELLDLLTKVQKEFSIQISQESLAKIKTVGNLLNAVEEFSDEF